MTPLEFWRFKILQLLHDPPGKPYARYYRGLADDAGAKRKGGHAAFARRLLETFGAPTDESISFRPDWAATGADRPVVGHGGQTRVIWGHQGQDPIATHPLACAPLKLDGGKGEPREVMPKDSFSLQQDAIEKLGIEAPDWEDADALKRAFFLLWRRLQEEVCGLSGPDGARIWKTDPKTSLLWQHIPADTRTPDHSVWDHNRMTSALAFLEAPRKGPLPPAREPWLFSFALGPVQAFIAEARTSRDLWVNSMLLADLSWHAMLPVVEHYGPDAVVYPDLKGNPMVDRHWMDHANTYPDLLPFTRDVRSGAALLPHHWVAIMPRGGEGYLEDLDRLAERCAQSVRTRWQTLSQKIRDRLALASREAGVDPEAWLDRWNKQHEDVIHTTWAAVPWRHLTAQPVKGASTPGTGHVAPREQWLRPWVPDSVWDRYEEARGVYTNTSKNYVEKERGFDYALVHHQLSLWHTMRKQARPYPRDGEDAAERCTVCHHRAALEPGRDLLQVDHQRARVRLFWEKLGEKVGEPAWGAERLCGVCAFRRLLVPFGQPDKVGDFNRVWSGSSPGPRKPNGDVLHPFPSTAAVAAQRFLRSVMEEDTLADARRAVADACKRAKWPRTFFPRSLPSLADLPRDRFLTYEPQVFYEQARKAELRREGRDETDEAWDLDKTIAELLKQVKRINRKREEDGKPAIPLPGSRVALVALDGDGLGRLLLGDQKQVGARWRDVFHPAVVKQLEHHPGTVKADWPALLDRPRLSGPSMQAFLCRALGDFAHRVVPWVVEREFRGRLIYAGGDDVLALVDADDALPLCARLHQLYSSPWVLDTEPGRSPWAHRGEKPDPFDPERDRGRLVIPDTSEPVALPLHEALPPVKAGWQQEAPVAPAEGWTGELLAMMGPHQSLSAGIVYAHFKTPLGTMVRKAHDLLDRVAKEEKGRAAFAAAVYSRGGVKVEFGTQWSREEANGRSVWPENAARIDRVREAFASSRLPGRLPYKLRESAWALEVTEGPKERMALLEGLVDRALILSGGASEETVQTGTTLRDDVVALWSADSSAAGLLLCRALSRHDEEEE